VSSIRALYSRFRHLIHEGAKFLIVGGIGTIVTFGVANALNGIGRYKAVTIATILATIITFLGNRHWSFRHRQGNGATRETSTFFILNGIGLLIYYASIWLIADAAGLKSKLWYNAALVLGTGLGTLFRFYTYRKWVWGATRGGPPTAGSADGGPGPDLGPEQETLAPVAAFPYAAPTDVTGLPRGVNGRSASVNGRSAAANSRPAGTERRHAGAHRRH
jgi:putative flippase GtrA